MLIIEDIVILSFFLLILKKLFDCNSTPLYNSISFNACPALSGVLPALSGVLPANLKILCGKLFLETRNKVDGVLVSIGIKYLHVCFNFHRLTYQYMRGRMGEELHRFKGLYWAKDANIHAFLVSFFSACSTSTDSVCLRKNPIKDKFAYWHILPFCAELKCRHYTS